MTYGTYGDFARWRMGMQHGAKIKSDLARSSTELSTGRKSDLAQHLGAATARLAGVDALLERLSAFADVTTTVRSRLEAQQAALSKVDTLRQNLASTVIGSGSNITDRLSKSHSAQGSDAFKGAIAALNTQTGGRYHFSGDQPLTRPLGDASNVLLNLKSTIDFSQPPGNILGQIDAFFNDPTGPFLTTHYNGGAAAGTSVQIGENRQIETGTPGSIPALAQTLAKVAGFAILDSIPVEKRNDFVAQLTPQLSSEDGVIHLKSQIGQREAAIQMERAEQSAQKTALGIERNALIAADPFETAAQLKQAETQLELHYTMLSRLSKLSLVHFAR